MQTIPFSGDLNLDSMMLQLKRMEQNEQEVIRLIENDSRFKYKNFNLLKQNLDAIKKIQVKSSYSQSELQVLNATIKDAQSQQATVVKQMNTIIKNNSGKSTPLSKQMYDYQSQIKAQALKAVHQTSSFEYARAKWKGKVSVKSGDSTYTNQVISDSVRSEGRVAEKMQKQIERLEALGVKQFSQAPPKIYDTSLQDAEDVSSQSFFEQHSQLISKAFLGVAVIGAKLAQVMQEAVSQMGQAQSTIFSAIGDMLDDPLNQMLGVMAGLGQTITTALNLVSNIISSVAEGISQIFSVDNKKDGGSSKLIGTVVSVIGNFISSLINMVVQQIQAGFQIFTTILTQTFKIIKKIQLSSPVIQAILDLINLAFNLFFMPFMNVFGMMLLDGVVKILNWALEMGPTFQKLGEELLTTLDEQGFSLNDILDDVKDIAVEFVTKYLPQILQLIPPMTEFALEFVRQILSHSEEIIAFITKGITVFGDMLKGGIIDDFLELGKNVLGWLGDHGLELVDFMKEALNSALGVASFFLGFIGGIGDVTSAISNGLNNIVAPTTPTTGSGLVSKIQNVSYVANNWDSISQQWGDIFNGIGNFFSGGNLGGNLIHAQSGGKFTNAQYNGGIPILAGEANEAEFKLNEQELREIGKDTTVTIQYNGSILSRSDFKEVVQDIVSDVSNRSHFR